jgi:uncharacterized protein (DUF1015 family)
MKNTLQPAAQLDFNPCLFACFKTCLYESSIFWKRYRQVNQKYQDFKAEKILVKDKAAAIYIHKIITTEHSFTGIIVGTSIEEYRINNIKKHEETIFRVDLKDYMKYSAFNTEPVLMTYFNKTIENWIFTELKN